MIDTLSQHMFLRCLTHQNKLGYTRYL